MPNIILRSGKTKRKDVKKHRQKKETEDERMA
jgi:hypothetical protein